ncbi:uncharacterized protein TM35_000021520 [Trypanosoma theileri]|uniref:Uncharacterized protein n=1 Tax=Trypanosoma theileri TaxID=67003 RepID=A0A1X0P794_9TRYP|nr:uncharacterized protein TM35_000021520 [Trypanosoma theileri]ORC92826.1 hypothetical protein TM35_000021520 [Trypanosoma theileri]
MALTETAVDDPKTLRRIMAAAQPSQSHVGRMMDASRAHAHMITGSPLKTYSAARKERDRMLLLQREQQAAWDVAAQRKLLLPELRTLAPSFTKTADEGHRDLGGTKIGGAGYNTIVGMIPTIETIKQIADDDELISSFRPYRIDALRAARLAEAAKESAPHPDDTRQLEPTLCALAANRLIDVAAIPDDVARDHWTAASVFAATNIMDETMVTTQPSTQPAETICPLSARSLHLDDGTSEKQSPPTGTSSFLTTERFKTPRKLPGVRQPDIGFYHVRYTQVEPRVVGGYMEARESAAPQKSRASSTENEKSVERDTDSQKTPPHGATMVMEGTKDNNFMATTFKSLSATRGAVPIPDTAAPTPAPESSTPRKTTPGVQGSSMFLSKTPRSLPSTCSAAKDLDYFPYADVRSTVKRTPCPVKFDVTLNERRHECMSSNATVGMYNLAGDISQHPHRVVCMDRESSRAAHWLNKPPPYQQSPEFVSVDDALNLVRPRTRVVWMAPQVSLDEQQRQQQQSIQKAPNTTVSIECDPNFPRRLFDHCEAKKIPRFATMMGRPITTLQRVPEAPMEVELKHVEKSIPAVSIHPTAPGHAPLHNPHPTEIGEIPNLKWVKPRRDRTTDFGNPYSTLPPPTLPRAHDLSYDTSKRALVEPRLTGNPMMETQVSREKRAKIFATSGCGAPVVYDVNQQQPSKLVPVFEKQITKETQFCGHRLQSERWQRKNPRAPGPGHYDVSYRLVE